MPFDGSSSRLTPKIRWSSLADLRRGGVERLLQAHWQESAAFKSFVPLDPNWEQYEALEKAGLWRCMAAWRDGKVVGYAGYIISPHMQFQSTVYVHNSSIYLEPSQRGLAPWMIKKAGRLLAYQLRPRKLVVVYEAPPDSKYAWMLHLLGYPEAGTVHARIFN